MQTQFTQNISKSQDTDNPATLLKTKPSVKIYIIICLIVLFFALIFAILIYQNPRGLVSLRSKFANLFQMQASPETETIKNELPELISLSNISFITTDIISNSNQNQIIKLYYPQNWIIESNFDSTKYLAMLFPDEREKIKVDISGQSTIAFKAEVGRTIAISHEIASGADSSATEAEIAVSQSNPPPQRLIKFNPVIFQDGKYTCIGYQEMNTSLRCFVEYKTNKTEDTVNRSNEYLYIILNSNPDNYIPDYSILDQIIRNSKIFSPENASI